MWNSNRNHTTKHFRVYTQTKGGQFFFPMILIILSCSSFAFGLIILMQHWNSSVKLQLDLNRCIINKIGDLKKILNKIEDSNKRILKIRALLLAAQIRPEIKPALNALLKSQIILQIFQLNRWKIHQIKWVLHNSCNISGHKIPIPIASLKYSRLPPDFIGENILVWEKSDPQKLRIQIKGGRLFAAALLEKKTTWKAHWTKPIWAIYR